MSEPGPGATAAGAGHRGLPAYRAGGPAEDPRPEVTAPRVLGIDFALRRGLVCATVLTDAETGRRVDVVPAAPPSPPDSGCAAGLRPMHSFTRGLDLDIQAATAAVTMPHHNGRTEGVSIKTKMIKRQRYGRAGFILPRHRILLG
jgi:hypothetical protein